MAFLFKSVWIVALFATVLSSVDVELTARPGKVENGLTHSLTLSCVARVNSSDPDGMVYVSSMIMTHKGQDVASVAGFPVAGPAMVFDDYKSDVDSARGNIDAMGESTLSISITSPLDNDTGNYSCKAVGGNGNNQPLTEYDSVLVNGHNPDNTTMLHGIVDMGNILNNLTERMERVERRWHHVDSDPLFTHHDSEHGSTYLLSRANLGPAHLAQFICFVQGGHLAELNTKEERELIQDILTTNLSGSRDVDVWVGTADEQNEGDWTHMYHVNATVDLGRTGFGSGGAHCTKLTERTGFQVEAADCASEARALCEVTHDDAEVF